MQGDTHSFIVRIWHEAVDKAGQKITWRGSIDHVGSGKRLHFQDDLGRIVRFIQEEVDPDAGRPVSRRMSLLTVIKRVCDCLEKRKILQ